MQYYLVRAKWGNEDKTEEFLENNYWKNGYDDKFHSIIDNISKNDILLLADGSYIRYYAKCKKNKRDGKTIYVDKWKKINKPIFFAGKGAYIKTIATIKNKKLIEEINNIIKNENITLFIKSLETSNFMGLYNETIQFSNINIFIGKNGSGKSQILKLLYSYILSNNEIKKNFSFENEKKQIISKNLIDVFKPDKIGNLVNFGKEKASVSIDLFDSVIKFDLSAKNIKEINSFKTFNISKNIKSVFIPTKEILSFFKGFRYLYEERELEFDKTYYELARTLEAPIAKNNNFDFIKNKLENILQGKIEILNGRFYLIKKNKKIEINLIAEGLRKIGLISYLIANGNIVKDSILFWDEPEANMHPSLIDDIVEILTILSNNGVQIFIATHSPYIIESFNNHLKRYKINNFNIQDKDIRDIEPLKPNNIRAYLLQENQKSIDLIVGEFGLIDDKLLNDFNNLSLIYEKMRDIEWAQNE